MTNEKLEVITNILNEIKDISSKVADLETENARLREALELIADDDCRSSACKSLEKQCDRCIARDALEEKND